jgi:hypothetical protein
MGSMSSTAVGIAVPEDSQEAEISSHQPLGPLWMTSGVVLLFAAYAALSALRHAMIGEPDYSHHVITYSAQILGTWLLLGATFATVYHRRSFVRESLLAKARPWTVELGRGIAVFALFLFVGGIVRGLFAAGSRQLGALHQISQLLQRTDHRFSVSHNALLTLAPASGVDLALWTFISLSAAVCEELIFRGYLLRQCIFAMQRMALSQRTSVALSVVLTAVLFGAGHFYEGAGSALTIAFLGATYAVAALRFGNLRAVIVAHFLQDFLVGLLSYTHHLTGR